MICFKNLKVINLADNQIGDQSLEYLSRTASMHHLEEIVLYGNTDITGKGIFFLSQSNFLKHIKKLDLHATSVDDKGLQELMQS